MATLLDSNRTRRAALLIEVPAEAARALFAAFRSVEFDAYFAASRQEAEGLLQSRHVCIVVATASALAGALDICEQSSEDIPVVALVNTGDDSAVSLALRAGARSVLGENPTVAELQAALACCGAELSPPLEPPARTRKEHGLLGAAASVQKVVDLVTKVAPTPATALIRGETGTGKELVARALHLASPRRDGPLVKVHCGALPDALLESELFGYERGAFTGAVARKPGRVELANGGTLFLDEIGDVTPAVQVKLLRLLQERTFERLGGTQTFTADVRFVAATHRDLETMVKKGDFREDLFYRLNVVTLWLPPLRARRDDVPVLASAFCKEFALAYGKPGATLDDAALRVLRAERWPGNVRQLRNFVERLVVLSNGGVVSASDVRSELAERVQFCTQTSGTHASVVVPPSSDGQPPATLQSTLKAAERAAIERALKHVQGNRSAAARILGISRATLYTKLEEFGVS
jgi:two-component system response regulator AtoC